MSQVFEVFYHCTKNCYGQEEYSSKTIDAKDEKEAEELVLYQLDKDYPEGENSIEKTKNITWIYKQK